MIASIISRLFGGGPEAPSRPQRRDDLFRSAFEQAPVGIAFVGRDGQWLQFNDRFMKLLGFPAEELVRTSLRELTHPDDRKIEAPHMRRLTSGDIPSYTITKRLLQRNRKYGHYRVHVASCSKGDGELDYYEYVISQSTEESAAAPAPSHDVSQIYQQVLDQLQDIAVIRSAVDGTIVSWNRGAEKIFGYKASEMLRKQRSILYRDADAFEQRPELDFQQALSQGSNDHEYWRIGKDGFALWTHVTLFAVRTENGAPEVVEFVRQPSHVKNNPAQEALSKRNEQLLIDSREAYESLQQSSNDQVNELHGRIVLLQQELVKRESREETLRHGFADLRAGSEETFRELKIMAEALKKEMQRRKDLENLLTAARAELEASNDRWKSELDEALATREHDVAAPLVEEPATAFTAVDMAVFETELFTLVELRESGVMIARREEDEIRLHLKEGVIAACTSNLRRTPLGEELVAAGDIDEEQRDRALEIQKQTDIPLGRVLLIMNAITTEQLMEKMEGRTRREITELRSWNNLEYAFVNEAARFEKLVPLHLDPLELWLAFSDDEPTLSQPRSLVNEQAAVSAAVPTNVPPLEPIISDPQHMETAPPSPIVGNTSKRSKKYHRRECKSTAKIPAASRAEFSDEEAARRDGLEPCSSCFKSKRTKTEPRIKSSKKEPR